MNITNSPNSLVTQEHSEPFGILFEDSFDPNINRLTLCGSSSGVNSDNENSLSRSTIINGHPVIENSKAISWLSFWKNVTIEPIMFLHTFSMSISGVVVQNLFIQRICMVSLDKPLKICDNLGNNTELEHQIDEIAAKYLTYKSLIEASFPILISLFLGPWTEIYGTKWPMILPLFGYFLSATLNLIFIYLPNSSPDQLLISSVPIALVGGLVSIVMSSFSFISKKTNLDNRSFRMAMLEAAWVLGGPFGSLSGSFIYKYGNFAAVFTTSAILFLGSFIYGWIVVQDVQLPPVIANRNMFLDIFNLKAVKDVFVVVFAWRTGLRRRWLILLLGTIFLRIIAMFGYLSNMYLYTRRRFHWDLNQYTKYSVSDSIIFIAGGYTMIFICLRILKLADPVVGILSTVGILLAQFVFAFAVSGWMIYLGASMQMFAGLISIIIRSMISKIVAKDEITRVFTFLACGEAFMPLIGGPLFSIIFSHTMSFFPGFMFMVSAAIYIAILINFCYLYFSVRNIDDHTPLQNQSDEDSNLIHS